MDSSTQVRLDEMRGADVYDRDGDKIGSVDEIYYDPDSNRAEWIGIGSGFFGNKRLLVPVRGASLQGYGIAVPYDKDTVKDSPQLDGDDFQPETLERLNSYYRLGETGDVSTATAEDGQSLTRSEEELRVGTRQVEAGNVRLRKWVETEPVELDVELRHETARIVREELNEPVAGHDFEEQEIEVPLHAEEPVVQKQVVAKERVGIETSVETATETVRDEVRKEHVEVEGDEIDSDGPALTVTGGGEGASPLPERPEQTFVIRHEERADVRKRWRGSGILRARRQVEVVQVDEAFAVDLETLASERVLADEHDSGRIHVLPDGSVSIPIYTEELIVTRRTVLKERVIIRKEIATETTNVSTELHAEHVEIDSEGRVDIVGDIG